VPDRVPGFYWVRHETGGDWRVALYYRTDLSDGWTVCGRDEEFGAADFAEIGPRVHPPNVRVAVIGERQERRPMSFDE
jgi:hypothetical protein